MARDGYRIFDSDTHVGPDARVLAGYLSSAEKDRLSGWEGRWARPRHKLPLLDERDPIDAEELEGQARGHKTWMSISRRQAAEFSG